MKEMGVFLPYGLSKLSITHENSPYNNISCSYQFIPTTVMLSFFGIHWTTLTQTLWIQGRLSQHPSILCQPFSKQFPFYTFLEVTEDDFHVLMSSKKLWWHATSILPQSRHIVDKVVIALIPKPGVLPWMVHYPCPS